MDASLERLGLVVVAAALGCAAGYAVGRFAPVAGQAAEAPTGLTKPVTGKRREASQRAVRKLNSTRFRCAECDYTTTAGPLGVHHKKSGHRGRIKADA